MTTVPETPPTRKPIAYYATLDRIFSGMAICDPHDVVSFQYASTGRWITLADEDAPRLQLHGRFDLAEAQRLLDGDKVFRCSKTLLHKHNRGLVAA